jgi:hypothetical protein
MDARFSAMALVSPPVPEIHPGRGRITAGETIGGRLVGFQGVVEVALVRRERSPAREHRVECASTLVRDARTGRYELDVPADVPPTAEGRRCAMSYVLTAKEALGNGTAATTEVTVGAEGHPHLDDRGFSIDRVLANATARHFHLELADADLRGGGRIAGRVHRHQRWAPGEWTVDAACIETWRAVLPSLAGAPNWERDTLWTAQVGIDTDPDVTWCPFHFELPPDLPPAVEAHALAWRYELDATRHARLGLDERAVLTPLLFEADR